MLGLKSNSSKDSLVQIPQVGMTLGFLLKGSTYFRLKIVSQTGLFGLAAVLIANWRATFSLLRRRGSLFASAQTLCAGEVLRLEEKASNPGSEQDPAKICKIYMPYKTPIF